MPDLSSAQFITTPIHFPDGKGHWGVVGADLCSHEIMFYDSLSWGDRQGHCVAFRDFLERVYAFNGIEFPSFTIRVHMGSAGWPEQSDGTSIADCE
jgi:hypothetical protein